MKKITILFLSAIAIAATYPLFAAQDFGFSDPILIVRDDTDSQRPYETSAVRMYFFNHPISQGNGNFSNSLKIPGKRVGDVVAVPGSKIDGWSSGMLAFLPQRNGSQLTSRVGMGPRGFKATGEQTTGITRNFNLNLSERVNESGRGLILADVRKARESEYGEGITNPYIGDGACGIGDSPYCSSPNTYISPAMIRDPISILKFAPSSTTMAHILIAKIKIRYWKSMMSYPTTW
ncbi:MAG TPA: hypothetical protein PK599_06470 [bacterium]|nr:hypothetical protein [bacterium]